MSFTVVSLFSGAGGSSLGYEQAGGEVLWANEFVAAAAETYAANHPETVLDSHDIRSITSDMILDDIGLDRGELDILDGSPPCASFSVGGKRSAKWGKVNTYSDTAQRTDDLFFEYARILKGLQPKTFVAENVPGLVQGPSTGYYNRIIAALIDCGYRVQARTLDASRLGVPQKRRRVIFVGVRNDLSPEPAHPQPGGVTPMSATFGPHASLWVYRPRGWVSYPASRPAPTVQATGINGRAYAQTCLMGVTRIDEDPDTGAPLTVSRDVATLHPGRYKRIATIAELRNLCGFPSDYILTGTFAQRWERLGRAVPPPMMRAVAETVYKEILCAV